jgi:hypothetical protein
LTHLYFSYIHNRGLDTRPFIWKQVTDAYTTRVNIFYKPHKFGRHTPVIYDISDSGSFDNLSIEKTVLLTEAVRQAKRAIVEYEQDNSSALEELCEELGIPDVVSTTAFTG